MEILLESDLTPALITWLNFKLGHPPPYSPKDVLSVEKITVRYEESWNAYPPFEAVTKLSVERAKLESLEPFGSMSQLEWLKVMQTTLSDISTIVEHPKLQMVDLPFNFIEDISPLLSLSEVFSLDLRGNPLSEASYYETVPLLKEKGLRPRVDEEDVWRLCREVHRRDPRATYGSDGRSTPRLVVPELEFEFFDKGALGRHDEIESRIEPKLLREALAQDEFDAAELALDHWDRPYQYVDHVDTHSLEETRERVDEAALGDTMVEALVSLDSRLDVHQVATEDDAVFEELGRRLYGWRSYPTPERAGLPDWWLELRRAWAYPIVDEEPAGLRFGDRAPHTLVGEAIWLRSPGVSGDGQTALVDHRRLYPVAWGPACRWCLAIRLGELDDRAVYRVERDRVFEWSYEPQQAFRDIEALLEAVDGLVEGSQFDEQPGEKPPHGPRWDFEAEPHHERAGHDEALAWLDASTLAQPLRDAVRELVETLEGVVWVREDAAKLDYWQTTNGVRFPAWYRELRQTLAWAEDADGAVLRWATGTVDGIDMHWQTSRAGVSADEHHLMTEELKMLPVAQSMYHDLLIDLRDEDTRRLYRFDREIHRQGDYTPSANIGWADVAAFFEDVDALVDSEGKPVAQRR